MGTLKKLCGEIGHDSSWGIWADAPFAPESEARFGQAQFKNGGVLDEKEFFANGEQIGEAISDWLDGTSRQDAETWMIDEAIDELIAVSEVERDAHKSESFGG